MLVLIGGGPAGMLRKELALNRRSTLVELARERVSATLIASAAVRHRDRVCAVVMARRQPGSADVIWVTLINLAGAAEAEAIRAEAAAAMADLRARTGILAE